MVTVTRWGVHLRDLLDLIPWELGYSSILRSCRILSINSFLGHGFPDIDTMKYFKGSSPAYGQRDQVMVYAGFSFLVLFLV